MGCRGVTSIFNKADVELILNIRLSRRRILDGRCGNRERWVFTQLRLGIKSLVEKMIRWVEVYITKAQFGTVAF